MAPVSRGPVHVRRGWTRRAMVLMVLPAALAGGWALDFADPRGHEVPAPPEASLQAALPFQVPPGFAGERVAGPPLVAHPLMAGLDEVGRLFVGDAAGPNLAEDPDAIRVLEDTDGAGRFGKSTLFVDNMPLPTGALWHDGALYVAAAPSLWRLQDTKRTGRADKRWELVTKFFSQGKAADIHGPFLGPDGRLYWTDGAYGGYEIKQPDGQILKGRDAALFRCKPDSSEVEVVCDLGSATNLGEVAFTPEGEAIAAVIPVVHDDALAHCIDGGVYFREPVDKPKRTGGLLPATHFGNHVAPCGMMRYRSAAFGAEYRDNLFSAQFNTHKVQRHILTRDGATFRVHSEDFLVSADPDFHPTDVLEEADGSLLVIDTGGWFLKACPTSRIAKPEITGGIYRIRRQDAPHLTDPRGLLLKWDGLTPGQLCRLLDDPRWVVRDRAVLLAAKRGVEALPALKDVLHSSLSVRARRNAVWALTRMESRAALAPLRTALEDKDASVRLSAAHAVGLLRDREALPQLAKLVAGDDPAIRREAATALGRLRQARALPALFDGLRRGGDRFLEHALIYALIEIADRETLLKGLGDASPLVRRGALIALDQMDGGNLTRHQVSPLLNTTDPSLQQTALAIIASHPGWASESIGLLRDWLGQEEPDAWRRESLRGTLLALAKDRDIQNLITQTLRQEKTPLAMRLLVLETIAGMPLLEPRPAWTGELGRSLRHTDERVVRQTVMVLRATGIADFDAELLALGKDRSRPASLRVLALAAAVPRLSQVTPEVFAFLVSQLDKDVPPLERLSAAAGLGHAKLDDTQLERLATAVAGAGPLELPHLLVVFEQSRSATVGQALVAALGKSPGLMGLAPQTVRQTFRAYPNDVRRAAEPLVKQLDVDAQKQKARLAELQPVLSGGDARPGRDVFFSKKAACSTCHAVRGEGGRVGPDLSKIGSIRSGPDLLEAIVFPSASLVRGYEPYIIQTSDGRTQTGILARETPDAVNLVNTERDEIRIPRSRIESLEPGKVSIMPQGLDAQLSRQELADLISFLLSLR